jgi:3'(2'), 5'-bisphosphate nucleotidase
MSIKQTFSEKEVAQILNVAKNAGDLIMEYYHGRKDLMIKTKEDDSPVTKADLDANDFINQKLQKYFPNIAIVSEENSDEKNLQAAQNDQCFMVDPIDGTSSFISKSEEWTVNIALIKNCVAVFGVIYLPAKDLMYFTNDQGEACKIENYSSDKSEVQLIKTTKIKNNLTIICTKREPEKSEIIADLKAKNIVIKKMTSVSSSYKFCLIAEGFADLYPRRINIKTWDVAAGHAIVSSAGGNMIDLTSNQELEYQLKNSFDVPFFEAY